MEVFSSYEWRLRDASSRRILVEVALLKSIEARNAVSLDTVLQKLNDLRSGAPAGNASVAAASPAPRPVEARPAPRPAAVPTSEPARATATALPTPLAPSPTLPPEEAAAAPDDDLGSLWLRVVDAVGRVSPFTRSYLLEAHPVSLTAKLLTIGFDPEFADHLELVDNSKNRELIQTKLQELGHSVPNIKFIKADAPVKGAAKPAPAQTPASTAPVPAPAPAASPAAAPAPAPVAAQPARPKTESVAFSKDDFKNDPLIQKALEIFKGQIVEVRA